MALKKISYVELLGAVIHSLKNKGIDAYYEKPSNIATPFVYVELFKQEPEDTQGYKADKYTIYIHSITGSGTSSFQVTQLADQVQETLLSDIEIPSTYVLLIQTFSGLVKLIEEKEGEYHAIQSMACTIGYGCNTKN